MFAVGISLNGLAHNGQLGLAVRVGLTLWHAALVALPLTFLCSVLVLFFRSSQPLLNPIRVRDFCTDRLHGTESSAPDGAPKGTAHAGAARLAPLQGGPGPPEAEAGRDGDGDALKESRWTIDTLQCMQCHRARMAFLQVLVDCKPHTAPAERLAMAHRIQNCAVLAANTLSPPQPSGGLLGIERIKKAFSCVSPWAAGWSALLLIIAPI